MPIPNHELWRGSSPPDWEQLQSSHWSRVRVRMRVHACVHVCVCGLAQGLLKLLWTNQIALAGYLK